MDERGIEALRERIRAQADAAGGGWMDLPVPAAVSPSGSLRVPRGAFERWSVSRAGGDHLTTPWTAVSPPGLKLQGDDRYHTDWILGSGLPLDAMGRDGRYPHAEALTDAAYAAMSDVARRLLDHESAVLLAGPDVVGRVHVPSGPTDRPEPDPEGLPTVLVVRDAGPDWLELAVDVLESGGAVVVERGGEMAHLVTALRGDGLGPIMRMAGARRLYPEGTLLAVSPGLGRLTLRDDGRPSTGQDDGPARAPATAPDRSPGDGWFPAPGPEYDGPPSTWPLRLVGEEEVRLIDIRERAMARARQFADDTDPGPFELVRDEPGRAHPAQAMRCMTTVASYGAHGLSAYTNLHRDSLDDKVGHAEFIVWEPDGLGRRPRSMRFYGPRMPWSLAALRRGAGMAIQAAREAWEPSPEEDDVAGPGSPGLGR